MPPDKSENELNTTGFMFPIFLETSTLLMEVEMFAIKIIAIPVSSIGPLK